MKMETLIADIAISTFETVDICNEEAKKQDEANDSYRMQIWMRMRVCGMASVRYGWKGKNIQKTDKRFALKWNIMQIVRAGIK